MPARAGDEHRRRSSELLRLKVGDVDLDKGTLSVWISKSKIEDDLPITSDLDHELREWLTLYAQEIKRLLRDEDFLLPARTGSRYVYRKLPDGTIEKGRTAPTWRPDKPMTNAHRVVQDALLGLGLPTKHEGVHTLGRAVARAFFDSQIATVGYDASISLSRTWAPGSRVFVSWWPRDGRREPPPRARVYAPARAPRVGAGLGHSRTQSGSSGPGSDWTGRHRRWPGQTPVPAPDNHRTGTLDVE